MDLFKKTTAKEEAKKVKKEVGRGQRDLTRERNKLEQEEKKCVADIKKLAQSGGHQAEIRVMAKNLVRIRNAKTKMLNMNSQLSSVKTTATMMVARDTQSKAMKSAAKAMGRANKAANASKVAANMQKFAMEMEKSNINEEMIDDALAGLDDEDIEDDIDAVTAQVLDELGIQMDAALRVAPSGDLASAGKQAAPASAASNPEAAMS